ncbi:hypothetical protein CEXT_753131 [Caerostris extrusa]|uniref:Uncharacterized protein n=1 Tax=Caerostris extrusa TaxID=172846 RepID=A0AAV4VBY7_CAEEX|nr:hypothetical protein CEXT_753131 [Caerostris extrusa]
MYNSSEQAQLRHLEHHLQSVAARLMLTHRRYSWHYPGVKLSDKTAFLEKLQFAGWLSASSTMADSRREVEAWAPVTDWPFHK